MSEINRVSLGATIAAGVGLSLAFGTVVIATFGLFMMAMSREFGWGMGQTAGLLSVAALAQAPLSPLVGRLLDRVGVRRVVVPGIVLYGASVMALSLANGSTVQLYALYALVGATSSLVTMLPYSKIVSAWFSRQRGTMLSAYSVLAAVLGSAVPQVARRLIDHLGWREAYLGLGLAVIVIGLPVMLLLLREPDRGNHGRAAPPPLAVGMSAREVWRSSVFWRIVLAIGLCSLAIQSVYAHLVPLLVERGLTRALATNALSLYALASISAQLAIGYLLDRSRSPLAISPLIGLSIVGLAVLYGAQSAAVALVGGMVLGSSVGVELSLAKFLHARYFGNRAFGQVFGVQFLFIGLSAAVAPLAMGLLHDATGAYKAGMAASGVLILFSVALIASLPSYDSVRRPLTGGEGPGRAEPAEREALA